MCSRILRKTTDYSNCFKTNFQHSFRPTHLYPKESLKYTKTNKTSLAYNIFHTLCTCSREQCIHWHKYLTTHISLFWDRVKSIYLNRTQHIRPFHVKMCAAESWSTKEVVVPPFHSLFWTIFFFYFCFMKKSAIYFNFVCCYIITLETATWGWGSARGGR